jgi:hypothetical protein
MRPLRLARVAMAAEALRLREEIRRAVLRFVLGSVAVGLLVGALLFAHVAAWYWLRESLPQRDVALIFAAVDVLLALLLGFIALRSRPSLAEREALLLREQALDGVLDSLSASALLIRGVELALASFVRR